MYNVYLNFKDFLVIIVKVSFLKFFLMKIKKYNFQQVLKITGVRVREKILKSFRKLTT
jgi:hypothetical protein